MESNGESNIVVLAFDGRYTAKATLKDIQKMQEDGLLEIKDAVVASRGPGGNVKIEQTHSEKGKFALRGSGIGLLAGLLVGGPIGGLVGGAAVGVIAGALKDYGIDDDFIEEVSESLKPDSSALFLMVSNAKAEETLERLKPFKAKVLNTTLSEEQEQKLKEVLEKEVRD
jgi:uncharacterized membrane protein